jgi:predicted acylesterase/phospholipase RssA
MDKYGKPYPCLISNSKILVLSGGAIKGIYLLGALNGLKQIVSCHNITTYIGISSGAIMSFLLTIGYSPYDIFMSLLKSDNFLSVNLDNWRLSSSKRIVEKRGGIFSSDHIFSHIKQQMKLKKIPLTLTFEEHFKRTKKRLVVMAFNVTKCKEDIFTYDTTPDMVILKALELSAGIPIIFKPLKYENNLYVDGGVWNNFPIEIAIKYRNNEDDGILAITTLHSIYKSSICKLYGSKNLSIVMVKDNPHINPTLVSSDIEKFIMYTAGSMKGESVVKDMNVRRRRNSL